MVLCDFIEKSLEELDKKGEFSYPTVLKDGIGLGIAEAPRGALAHLVTIEKEKIKNYPLLLYLSLFRTTLYLEPICLSFVTIFTFSFFILGV